MSMIFVFWDTAAGWSSVQAYARDGVPFAMFLHQRHYGGAFRQLLDATSTERGNLIEDAVEELLEAHGISFVRTGAHNQREIEERFEVAVHPAPDFRHAVQVLPPDGLLRQGGRLRH